MPRKVYTEQVAQVLKKPVFGVGDLVNLGLPRKYAGLRLHQLFASGKILRVERDKYTALDDAVLVAAHLTEPCYITLWSALSLRGLTTQIPFTVQVATSRQRYTRRISFMGNTIQFYVLKPGMMFGYEHVSYGHGYRISLARVEKIIIDALYLGEVPLEELEDAFDSADAEKLEEYSVLTGNKHIMKTVGEMLRC